MIFRNLNRVNGSTLNLLDRIVLLHAHLHVGSEVSISRRRHRASRREHLLVVFQLRLSQILADFVALVVVGGSRGGIKTGVRDPLVALHTLRSRGIERMIGVNGGWDCVLGRCLEV